MIHPMSGVIAIVGRPNVGKSALFNRIARKRIAIVHDQPGVTRDRVTAEAEWHGRPFTLIDTGGIGLMRREKAVDVIMAAMLDQVELALEAASVIILVVNVQEGIVPLDAEVASKLHSTNKPVIVAVNKVDTERASPGVAEFARLGFDRVFPITAIHGSGIEDLMEEACGYLPPHVPAPAPLPKDPADETDQTDPTDPTKKVTGPKAKDLRWKKVLTGAVRIAIVGRPNVGKSSLINSITGSNRVIVSPIPGTTRDAVDVPFEVDTEGVREKYMLIDTAGVRKARRIDDSIEYFSVERTKGAIAKADISVLVIDAVEGITEQDKKIADIIVENRCACIVVVNKWDLVAAPVRKAREAEIEARIEKSRDRDDRRKRLTTLSDFGQWVQERLFFLDYAPVIFTSATEGFQLDRLLEAVRYVGAQLRQAVPTGIVNRSLHDAIERRQPVSKQGHRLKFYYATQVGQAPAIFRLYVNRDELFSPQYEKYLGDQLRKAFGYEGCPVIIQARPRPRTIDPVRNRRHRPFAANREVRHGKVLGSASPRGSGTLVAASKPLPGIPKDVETPIGAAARRKIGYEAPSRGKVAAPGSRRARAGSPPSVGGRPSRDEAPRGRTPVSRDATGLREGVPRGKAPRDGSGRRKPTPVSRPPAPGKAAVAPAKASRPKVRLGGRSGGRAGVRAAGRRKR
jgi:GTP-binding protein